MMDNFDIEPNFIRHQGDLVRYDGGVWEIMRIYFEGNPWVGDASRLGLSYVAGPWGSNTVYVTGVRDEEVESLNAMEVIALSACDG